MKRFETGRTAATLFMLAVGALSTRTPLPAQSGPVVVTLDAATRHRLAIDVIALSPAKLAASAESLARVVDPAPLAQIDGEISAALSASAVSRAEADRARTLYADDQNISARERDTAVAQLRADELRLEDARRRLQRTWGEGIARLDDAARRRLVEALLGARCALVRVELPGEFPATAPSEVELSAPHLDASSWMARVLGPLPEADAELQTAALLTRVDRVDGSGRRLPVGMVLAARLPTGGPDQNGVVLPRGALLRREGALWAYVERAPNEFERRRVDGGRAIADGWFVASGFAPGDGVVRSGAADLLAAERPVSAAAPAADADDD